MLPVAPGRMHTSEPLARQQERLVQDVNFCTGAFNARKGASSSKNDKPERATAPLAPHTEEQCQNPTDGFLLPTLAQNEVQRLKALWYLMKDIKDDQDLIERLGKTMSLAREVLGRNGFEADEDTISILGLVDNDVFTRCQ